MEISYDIIIKYLSKNNKINFSNKKHILLYSDKFPEIFSNLLQDKFYKYGITIFDKNNINISFFTSLLTLLHNKFLTFTEEEEFNCIGVFKKNINTYIQLNCLNKKDLNDLPNNIQIISEILNCIFLIFDFKNNKIKIVYPDEICNPWKPILLFANYDELWEPIMYDTKRIFSYNESIIKKLFSNIEYYETNKLNKIFILNDNIKEIIEEVQNKFLKLNSLDTFVKNDNIEDDEIKLNKKTKNELIDICKLKNIKVNIKMLKKEIINLILIN